MNIFGIFYNLKEFLRAYKKYFQVELCVPLIRLKQFLKIIFRLICFIVAYVLDIIITFKSLLGIIQTYFFKLAYNNYNNILIWSKDSKS